MGAEGGSAIDTDQVRRLYTTSSAAKCFLDYFATRERNASTIKLTAFCKFPKNGANQLAGLKRSTSFAGWKTLGAADMSKDEGGIPPASPGMFH